jgi:hypothetical protein
MESGKEYTINITAESLRAFIEAMREEGQFSELFDTGFSGSSFWAKVDRSGDRPGYKTRVIIKPQESSVRIRVVNDYPEGSEFSAPPLAWGKIRADLERSGYEVKDVTGFEVTAVFEHSYIDPGRITNSNHRKIVRALIEAELSSDRVRQADIAKRFGYSAGRLSEIKKLYLRPEFQNSE